MRCIFAETDRSLQITRIREAIAQSRSSGAARPEHFQMHPVYDEILAELADHFLGCWKDRIAILGMGGYGRREMSPYSDIDLLFLKKENTAEQADQGIRHILYLLWDARVELGHSVRTVEECTLEAQKDLAVLTSLMDIRYLWGDEQLFRRLAIERDRLIQATDPLDLYLRIEEEIRKSSERYGHTIYLLEPHLKEGPGSLRYIQLMLWLCRMVFGVADLDSLPLAEICDRNAVEQVRAGLHFLAEVRTRLHLLAGRRDDRLKFDAQAEIAQQMGFQNTDERRGVVAFMREYYRHAATLDFFGRRVLARVRLFLRPKHASAVKRLKLDHAFYIGAGGINHYDVNLFGSNPREILGAFLKMAEMRCDLDIRLVDRIAKSIRSLDLGFIHEPETNRLFLKIFSHPGSVARVLTTMMKVGFLEVFIPDFAHVRFLPQYDVYHQYTVDLHTMVTLEQIDAFARPTGSKEDALLRTIFARQRHPEVLYLAALFHDIAKGRGPGHDVRGETIARPILKRMGLAEESVEEVCFLIRNHLAIPQLAFKKDLHDDALIQRFAENVLTRRRLELLVLLTYADLRASSSSAFNSWRNMLLEELYFRTLDVLQGEGLEGEDFMAWVREIKAAIRDIVPPLEGGIDLEEFLEAAPPRYFLDFSPGVVAEHFVSLRTYLLSKGRTVLGPEDVIATKVDHRLPGYSSITLIMQDSPGLFCKIAGTLAANRINILGASSHAIGRIAVCTFHVNDIPEGPLDDPKRWHRFQNDFQKVIRGELDVDQLVATRRATRSGFRGTTSPRFPVRVEIDNAASDRATIVEVYAHDRPGLLYDITRTLFSFGLNIVLAKITTEIDQAADIFYVQTSNGEKLVEFEELTRLREGLLRYLCAMEDSYFLTHTNPTGAHVNQT